VTLNDLELRNGPLILRYFTEFGSFRGALRKSGRQRHNYGQFTITIFSRERLQRDRATPTVYIPSRFVISRLNAQYLPSYRFDAGRRTLAFDWYPNRRP